MSTRLSAGAAAAAAVAAAARAKAAAGTAKTTAAAAACRSRVSRTRSLLSRRPTATSLLAHARFARSRLSHLRHQLMARAKPKPPAAAAAPPLVRAASGRVEGHDRLRPNSCNPYRRRRSTNDQTWAPGSPIILSSLSKAVSRAAKKSNVPTVLTRTLSSSAASDSFDDLSSGQVSAAQALVEMEEQPLQPSTGQVAPQTLAGTAKTSQPANTAAETSRDQDGDCIMTFFEARPVVSEASKKQSVANTDIVDLTMEDAEEQQSNAVKLEKSKDTSAAKNKDVRAGASENAKAQEAKAEESTAEEGKAGEKAEEQEEEKEEEKEEGTKDEEAVKPCSLFTFAMPEETLKTALEARQKGFSRYWSYEMYRGPDDKKVELHYCRTKERSEEVAKMFRGVKTIGFDLEWKPFLKKDADASLKDRISLIQFASEDCIGLFHVANFTGDQVDELVAPTLKQILQDETVTKLGVNISGDASRLREYLDIDCKGLFELSHLHRLVKYAKVNPRWVNKRLVALSYQVEEHLQLPLFKGEVRVSDWTRVLRPDQIRYAASDVYSSLHLFDALDMKRRAMKPVPPLPDHWDKKAPIRLSTFESFSGKSSVADDEADDPSIEPVGEDGDVATGEADKSSAPDPAEAKASRRKSSTATKAKKTSDAPAKPEQPPELVRAESWAKEYRNTEAFKKKEDKLKCTRPELRAYWLWQHQKLDVPQLASTLDVKETTVASYVARTLQLEEVVYDCERVRLLLTFIPASIISSRFWKFKYGRIPPAPTADKIVVVPAAVEVRPAA